MGDRDRWKSSTEAHPRLRSMQRWRGYEAAPGGWGRSVVTIGVFDGVHRGHQAIIGHAVKRARDLGVRSVVVTFDPHPAEVVRPGSHPAVLTEPARKAELIEAARRRRALRGAVHPGVLPAAGRGVRARRAGRAPARGARRGGGELPVRAQGGRRRRAAGAARAGRSASRSRARRWSPTDGDGRSPPRTSAPASTPATWRGGRARWAGRTGSRASWCAATSAAGSSASRPRTCCADRYAAVPPTASTRPGCSAAAARSRLPAAVSIGTNPTFSGRERRVEAYVLDFDGDLYGERVALDFVARLREQRTLRRRSSRWSRRSRQDVEQTRACSLR